MSNTPLSLRELVDGVMKLTSFPDVAMRLDEALSGGDADAKEISRIIESDPALTAALLRLANSASYHLSGTIDSVDRAVMTVGFAELRDLVFAVSAAETFRGIPNDLVSVEDFWRHSLACGAVAQQIAKHSHRVHVRSPLIKGLLHDIGHLVMFSQAPELSRRALELSLDEYDGRDLHLAELKIFGFDHTEVGAAIAEEWKFPLGLRLAIRYHHTPDCAPEYKDSALLIHVANCLAVVCEVDGDPLDEPELQGAKLAELGLEVSTVNTIVDGAKTAVDELIQIFVS